jgi:allophanate hydrolase
MSAPPPDVAAALVAGTVSPTAAVAAAYERLAAGQPEAWIAVVPEGEARARAARLEAEGPQGRPLWGVPFAVKDNIDVAGMPTTAACPAFAYEAGVTAPAVQRLLDAGAVLVGKTNLDQFATGLVGTRSPYGTCRSVLDPERVSGGSSSGSAVAVAEGVVAFALGTDTAGSGRVPAAANGIVGLKPTRGLVSIRGVVPACRSIDCLSVFARSVAGAVAVRDVLAAPDDGDPFSRTLPAPGLDAGPGAGRWQVGVPLRASWGLAPPEEAAFARTVSDLAVWADVVEIDPEPFLAAGALLYGGALVAERLTTAGDLLAADPEAVHPVVREVLRTGLRHTAADLFTDLHRLAAAGAEARRRLAGLDALVFPTVADIPTVAAVAADPVGENVALGRWTTFVNLLDLCAVTVPTVARPDGMVASATVIGPAFADDRVAAVASLVTGEARADAAPPAADGIHLAVVGAHLRGMPLHHQLTERAARFVSATRTAPTYRLHALATDPPKPGMVRDRQGGPIEVEVYTLGPAGFGTFVAAVPPPLTIGSVELEDGSWVKGFLCEPDALSGAPDITASGSWRAWLAGSRQPLADG